jgi:uncharacterized protein YigA (DUF484 family)
LFDPSADVLLSADVGQGDPILFGPAAGLVRSQALLRLNIGKLAPQGLLAVGSRRDDYFHPHQGTELLSFLARTIDYHIRVWLDLPRAT